MRCVARLCLLSAGSYAQSVAALLMTWAVIGWLLPTLMLLPIRATEQPEPSGAEQQRCWRLQAVVRGGLEAPVEAWLRRLLPFGSNCALCWLVSLCTLWLLCCSVAPLYGGASEALPGGA